MNIQSIAIAIVATIMLSVLMVSGLTKTIRTTLRSLNIESYANEVFTAMQPYYLSYANDNGHCYNLAPPELTVSVLVEQELLDNISSDYDWFDAYNALASYEANTSSGLIQYMVLTVTVNENESNSFPPLANQYAKTDTTITFRKPLSLNNTHLATAALNTSFCQE